MHAQLSSPFPNKIYVKECLFIRCKMHISVMRFMARFQKRYFLSQTRNTTSPLRAWVMAQIQTKDASSTQGVGENVLKKLFWLEGLSRDPISLGCHRESTAGSSTTGLNSSPGLILNPDFSDLSICFAPPHNGSHLKNQPVNLLTQGKVQNWNTARGLNINCTGGFSFLWVGMRSSTRSISLVDPLFAVLSATSGKTRQTLKRLASQPC